MQNQASATGAEQADPAAVIQDGVTGAAGRTRSAARSVLEGDVAPLWELLGSLIVPAIGVLIGVVVAYFLARLISRLASAPIRRRVDETLGLFVGQLIFYSIMICALLAIAGSVGINVTSFAAVLGAAGFAVGLAFQGTLSNFSSGVMLLVFRPFKVGDFINAAGVTAKVNAIDLFNTTFDTPDNRRIIVPNSQIAGGTIENITFHSERRVDVLVGTDYAASLDQTRDVLERAAESLSEQLLTGDGRGYQIVLTDLGDSAVGWTVRFWTKRENYGSVKEALTRAIKQHLDEVGIGIPFQQVDVHINGER